MKTSAAGRASLTAREGLRLNAYRDSVGVWTIGVGHTGRMAPPAVRRGMTISREQADAYLAADLAPVEAALGAVLTVPVTQNEWDALVSLLFNVGIGYAKPSMTIIRQLNLGNVKAAASGFDLFHRPPEIIGRRTQEKAQFLRPDAPQGATPTPVVIDRRAATLQAKADASKSSSRSDTKLAADAGLAAAGIAAAQPAVAHHHGALWIVCFLAVLVAAGAAIAAILSRRKAETLSAKADAHAAARLDAGTTNLVDALQQ